MQLRLHSTRTNPHSASMESNSISTKISQRITNSSEMVQSCWILRKH
ncbi:hypothetical protein FGIG_12545 [Fasciola gigantica]|uniref:Uncharacterized protein n=1 Tax=Fasciola gigantica TaxID=46835 RepID=A0A504YPP9_FASGI|nr:hypothetical protein FGIG_12545 [Fasciola gigantica]